MAREPKQVLDPSRELALEILERVDRSGAFASHELNSAFERVVGPGSTGVDRTLPRRALVSELVYGTLAQRGRLDWSLARCVSRGLQSVQPRVLTLLRMASYELLFLTQIPDHATVHTAVELTRHRIHASQARFVNAVLRSLLRRRAEEPTLLSDRTSHPQWIVELLGRSLPAAEQLAALEANNGRPPLTIRSRGPRDELATALHERGFEVVRGSLSRRALIVRNPEGLFETELFARGAFVAQDEAAQLVAELAAPRPGELVVEIGAGLGGKTTQLAELAGGEARIIAVDTHAGRLAKLERRIRELGIGGVTTRLQDATAALDDWQPAIAAGSVDCVVVDAPCSGLGVLRRQPEIRWRRTPEQIEGYASQQRAMLTRAAELLKPGGRLIYAVCTFTDAEGAGVVEAICRSEHLERWPIEPPADGSTAESLRTPDGDLRTWPHRHGADGFFVSRLRKLASP